MEDGEETTNGGRGEGEDGLIKREERRLVEKVERLTVNYEVNAAGLNTSCGAIASRNCLDGCRMTTR